MSEWNCGVRRGCWAWRLPPCWADDAPGAGLSERNGATAQVLDALRR